MSFLRLTLMCLFCCVLLAGCKGTGVLLMPVKDDALEKEHRCSPVFMKGDWKGHYGKNKIELSAKPADKDQNSLDLTVWVQNKKKKNAMIPFMVLAFKVEKDTFALCAANIAQLLDKGKYDLMSGGFLYPVMKIFKVTQRDKNLVVQEVIFTEKGKENKLKKLDPAMKMWGENSNMLYGKPRDIVEFIKKGKFKLSEEIVLEPAKKK